MKKIIYLIVFQLFTIQSFAQSREVLELEKQRKYLINKHEILKDSIRIIENKIEAQKVKEVLLTISDSTLRGVAIKGAKLKKSPDPLGEVFTSFDEEKEIVILDYSDLYFGVCSGTVCGYMSEIWIKKSPQSENFIAAKNFERDELQRLESERKMKVEKVKWIELEKKYINKYGEKDYAKMKQGYYWIGMNKEMATISLGSPETINRSVGSWGVHEQWVYKLINLYFENGVLKSYQN